MATSGGAQPTGIARASGLVSHFEIYKLLLVIGLLHSIKMTASHSQLIIKKIIKTCSVVCAFPQTVKQNGASSAQVPLCQAFGHGNKKGG